MIVALLRDRFILQHSSRGWSSTYWLISHHSDLRQIYLGATYDSRFKVTTVCNTHTHPWPNFRHSAAFTAVISVTQLCLLLFWWTWAIVFSFRQNCTCNNPWGSLKGHDVATLQPPSWLNDCRKNPKIGLIPMTNPFYNHCNLRDSITVLNRELHFGFLLLSAAAGPRWKVVVAEAQNHRIVPSSCNSSGDWIRHLHFGQLLMFAMSGKVPGLGL